MKKIVIAICVTLGIPMTFQPFGSLAEDINTDKPSNALMYHDIVISMLLPRIQKQINDFYSTKLTENPDVYPYMIYVENVKRLNGFRSFYFKITLKVIPTVGPHISVGTDNFTFKIDGSKVVLSKFNHIKTEELHLIGNTLLDKDVAMTKPIASPNLINNLAQLYRESTYRNFLT